MDKVIRDILHRIKSLEDENRKNREHLTMVLNRQEILHKRLESLEKKVNNDNRYLKMRKEFKYLWEDIRKIDDRITEMNKGTDADFCLPKAAF
ncbi:MAG TPA: hypothetical protein GXX49_10800 [Clostridiaceae bacterium]|jgi:chromosome segregation ATPase|nr:hypothetical protein [Clostridiaceae bacterium]